MSQLPTTADVLAAAGHTGSPGAPALGQAPVGGGGPVPAGGGQQAPPETPASPAGAPLPPPSIDLTSQITLPGGGSTTLGEVIQQQQTLAQQVQTLTAQNQELSNVRDASLMMMDPTGLSQQEIAHASRTLYKAYGMSEEEIERTLSGQQGQPQPQGQPQGQPQPNGQEPQQQPNGQILGMNQMQDDYARRQLKEIRRRDIERGLASSLDAVFDTDETLKVILSRSSDAAGARGYLGPQILERAKQNLVARNQASNGRFDDSWIAEEVSKAAKEVGAGQSAVIGDPAQLGASPEVTQGVEQLSKMAQAKMPEFQNLTDADAGGEKKAATEVQVKDAMAGELAKMAMESAGGESAI